MIPRFCMCDTSMCPQHAHSATWGPQVARVYHGIKWSIADQEQWYLFDFVDFMPFQCCAYHEPGSRVLGTLGMLCACCFVFSYCYYMSKNVTALERCANGTEKAL